MKNYLNNWNDFLDKTVNLLMEDPIKVKKVLFFMEPLFFRKFLVESYVKIQ